MEGPPWTWARRLLNPAAAVDGERDSSTGKLPQSGRGIPDADGPPEEQNRLRESGNTLGRNPQDRMHAQPGPAPVAPAMTHTTMNTTHNFTHFVRVFARLNASFPNPLLQEPPPPYSQSLLPTRNEASNNLVSTTQMTINPSAFRDLSTDAQVYAHSQAQFSMRPPLSMYTHPSRRQFLIEYQSPTSAPDLPAGSSIPHLVP